MPRAKGTKATTGPKTSRAGKIKKKGKQEALTVSRFINEVLVSQLSIPLRQIVNDTTFQKYTGSKRPDLLISEFEYDQETKNDDQYIQNLVAFAEAKDDCVVGDADWLDAIKQGKEKAPKVQLPYYVVTNCKTTKFFNVKTGEEIKLNGNPIREFQTIDILRLIKNRLTKNPAMIDIITNVDSLSVISEAVFNKKLWELAKVYRNIDFENNAEKIDFTIGFISLEYFEERETRKGAKDATKIYWSDCSDGTETYPAEKIVADLAKYITRLGQESQFGEFSDLMEKVKLLITGTQKTAPKVKHASVRQIYNVINSMRPLHGAGFDIFGAVYEKFADAKEKKEFGQYFTRRHYAHIFAKLLLRDERYFDKERKFKILDPACGTGGFLTESFKVLRNAYAKTNTLTKDAGKFLEDECFWGVDVKGVNISRTKLNMFLVGDGHTHMEPYDTLQPTFKWVDEWDYVITNPPVGAGVVPAETSVVLSNRTEIAFLYKVIKLLKDGGKACILLPDGVLENPQFTSLRLELLEKCHIEAIVSLPKFAFAPYTKEKMYVFYFTKKNKADTKPQKDPIWLYIIDNDGLANSDKRFPTKLRNNRNGWLHDEISGWVSTEGEEMSGLLEERWLNFNDSAIGGTEWINEKGQTIKLRKGGFLEIAAILTSNYHSLLPEYYLRPFEPKYVTVDELAKEIQNIEAGIAMLVEAK
jgi:type I restriction enzyme M protein